MKNAASISPRGWRHRLAILTIALVLVLGAVFGLALPCDGYPNQRWSDLSQSFRSRLAGVNLKAQPSGHLVMQSSEQVVDAVGHPWQITVYKYPQSLDPQPLLLGLKATQTGSAIPPETPLQIRLQGGQTVSAPAYPWRSSLDWPAPTFDAQYDLSTVWSTLAPAEGITLILPTESNPPNKISISTQILQEWHTVASCQALLCAFH